MKFEVLVLGSSSATPMHGRHPSAQLININENLMLVDCGEGTQMQLVKYGIKTNRIKYIFISHLHGDHYLGLMGLMSSMHLMGRREPLTVFGPEGLKEIIELQLFYSQTQIHYPLIFNVTPQEAGDLMVDNDALSVRSFPLDHRIPCTGFRFFEKAKSPKLDMDKVQKLGVPKSFYKLLKKGIDYKAADGEVHSWKSLTSDPDPVRSYAYCSDTLPSGGYLEDIEGVDLLYHEATFLDEMTERAAETYHTTAKQAAQIAKDVHAKQLLIGHYSARYRDVSPLLEEAKSVFEYTKLAIEGDWYTIH